MANSPAAWKGRGKFKHVGFAQFPKKPTCPKTTRTPSPLCVHLSSTLVTMRQSVCRARVAPAVVASLALALLAATPSAVVAAVGRVVASSTVSGHPIVVYWDETNTQRKLTLQVSPGLHVCVHVAHASAA